MESIKSAVGGDEKISFLMSNYALNVLFFFFLLFIVFFVNSSTASTELTTKFSGTIVKKGCSINIPDAIDMGEYELNKQGDSVPFDIKIDCGNIVTSTSLWAGVIKGNVVDGGWAIEMLSGSNTLKPFKMELKVLTQPPGLPPYLSTIDVRGNESSTFCPGNTTRDCSITPYFYGSDAAGMSASASVRFNLKYN